PQAKKNLKPGIIPVSAEAELTLRKAADAGFISYLPGSSDFEILKPLSPEQERALEYIRENVLKPFGSTGVQKCLNKAVFDLLGYRVVYPVANLSKLSDKEGRILPDAFLVKPGTRLKEFAYQIHTELGERFLGGIGLDRKRLSADYELQDGDIIEILVR
ncbi:MAG: redox-regulated ATPase YchF, partial [Candidatus Aenigmatarchaeota archaeon]